MNARRGRVEPKSSNVERAGDYMLACGIYREEDAPAARRVEAARRIR